MGPFLECGSYVRSNGLNENAALGLIGWTIWEGLRGVVVLEEVCHWNGLCVSKAHFQKLPFCLLPEDQNIKLLVTGSATCLLTFYHGNHESSETVGIFPISLIPQLHAFLTWCLVMFSIHCHRALNRTPGVTLSKNIDLPSLGRNKMSIFSIY